jgi:hypothetical protein
MSGSESDDDPSDAARSDDDGARAPNRRSQGPGDVPSHAAPQTDRARRAPPRSHRRLARARAGAGALPRGFAHVRRLDELRKLKPGEAATIGHIFEIGILPRHAVVPGDIVKEQLLAVVTATMEHVALTPSYVPGDALPRPPFVRRGRETSSTALRDKVGVVATAERVPSRRHGGDTPAVALTEAAAEAAAGSNGETAARYRLYEEAVAAMQALALQYRPIGRGSAVCAPAQRQHFLERLIAELKFLHAACSASEAKLAKQLDVADEASWARLAQTVLKSAYLHKQIIAATDALEEVARAII